LLCIINAFSEDIGILYSNTNDIYEKIARNFISQSKKNRHKVIKIDYIGNDVPEMAKNINNKGCKYIFTIGSNATSAAKSTGIKGVFTMVVDPVNQDLIDRDGKPKGALTGVLINVSPDTQFSTLKLMFKNHSMSAGIIYNPDISGFVVSEYRKSEPEYDYQILEFPVSNSDEIPEALNRIKTDANFILSVVDNMVYNSKNAQFITRFSVLNKIPLIGFSPQMVEAGALIGFYCDYPKLGDQSANLMEKLIKAENVYSVQVELPDNINFSINKTIASVMKVDISETLKNNAEKLYGN